MIRSRSCTAAWLCSSALCALPALAEEIRIVSPRPDSVSVTIYRDLFALVTETRTVDLPAGPVTLVFDGVVDTLIPQSAAVADTGRVTNESNYDFDRLTPARILAKSIGKKVRLTRTNPATGKVREVDATLVAAGPRGVIFQTADGAEALQCSGLPEQLTFGELPGDPHAKASLSIRLAAGAAGRRQVKVSYIAHGLAWKADYVGNLDANAPAMELLGWLTLENFTTASFHDAHVQVVAGRLNLLGVENRGTSLIGDTAEIPDDDTLEEDRNDLLEEIRDYPENLESDLPNPVEYFHGCYPLQNTSFRRKALGMVDSITAEDIGRFPDSDELQEIIVVTGFRGSMAVRENLADYQMYQLPGTTDLAARQTKQVAFLHAPAVKVDRFYALRLASEDMDDSVATDGNYLPIDVKVGWRNRKADGLGEPLPGGTVRFFEAGPGGYSFVGENHLKDTSTETPVELMIAKSVDLGVALDGDEDAAEQKVGLTGFLMRRAYLSVNLRVINDKPRAVTVEIRQGPVSDYQDWRVVGASLAPKRKAGDYVWRFEVPAGSERTLTYKVGGRVPD
jgi:hypothetical protein